MNRRQFIGTATLATTALAFTQMAFAAPGMMGKLSPDDFDKINKKGNTQLAALEPTKEPLSEADTKLLMEVAMGGMMQLQLSQVAVKKATSPDVMMYAKAEVEEQTGIKAKLMEVAKAKGVALPKATSEKAAKELTKLEELSGAEFDKAYLKESGVAGHKMLQATMTKVEAKAQDATLKAMAMTALPVIKMHLQVAEDELSDVKG